MRVLKRCRTAVAAFGVGLMSVLPVSGPALADTLADAFVSSYRNSNLLEQNRALLRAADEDVQQAIAALGPVVQFVATATANSNQAPAARLSMELQASIPLFDFGRGRMAVDAARETVLATRAALVGIEQGVLLNAVRSYMAMYGSLQTAQLQQNNVSVISEQLRAARERFELGDSTRTDVAIADARLAAARSALSAAQGDVAVAREDYNLAVGRYPQGMAPPPALPRLPASLEAAQDVARRNHPSIMQAQHQVSAAELRAEIAQTQRLGTLTGSLSAGATATRSPPLPSNTDTSITGSVRYSTSIYSGGQLASVERQAAARVQAQRASLHQTVAIVQQSVATNWAQLQVARARLAASDLQIEASRQAYEAVRAEADLGSRTTLDVLNAEQELLDARSNAILASSNVHLAAYALLESMGRLTVESLALGIPTYDVTAYASGFRAEPPRETPSEQGARLDRIMGRFRHEGP